MAEFMTGLKRTNYCGELRAQDCGKTVTVCGWVQRQRDLGQLIFIDLRDRTGIVQLSFDDSTDKGVFEKAFAVRSEYVLAAVGTVCERTSKTRISRRAISKSRSHSSAFWAKAKHRRLRL